MTAEAPARDQLDFRTLCDALLLKLREEILNGTLKPGQRLEQTELASRFGISRMPVRDALRRLEAEGLVSVDARRGAVVCSIDLEEMREIYEIREALESLALRLAAPNMTEEDVEDLARLEEQMEDASRRGDMTLWRQLDAGFHHLIFHRCNRQRLLKLITSYWNTTHHFRRAYVAVAGATARGEAMHRQMMEAVRARDAELLGILGAQHTRESVRSITEAHRKTQSSELPAPSAQSQHAGEATVVVLHE